MQCYPQKIGCFLVLCHRNRQRNFPGLPASVTVNFVERMVNWGQGLVSMLCVDIIGFCDLADYLDYPRTHENGNLLTRVSSLLHRFRFSNYCLEKTTTWFTETDNHVMKRLQADPLSQASFICGELELHHNPPEIRRYETNSYGYLPEYKPYWLSLEGLFLNGRRCSQNNIAKKCVKGDVKELSEICRALKAAFIASNGQTQTNRTRKMKKAYGGRIEGQTATIEYKRVAPP